MEIVNVFRPRGSNLPIARGVAGRYNDPDYGLSLEYTGKAADRAGSSAISRVAAVRAPARRCAFIAQCRPEYRVVDGDVDEERRDLYLRPH